MKPLPLLILPVLVFFSELVWAQKSLKYYQTRCAYDSSFVYNDNKFEIDGTAFFNTLSANSANSRTTLDTILSRYQKGYIKDDQAIILVKHPYNDTTKSLNKKSLIYSILHSEDGKTSEYLLDVRKILVVFIAESTDTSFNAHNIKLTITNSDGRLKKSAKDLYKLITASLSVNPAISLHTIKGMFNVTIVELTKEQLSPPSTIAITYPGLTSNISITDHERSSWSFQAGVAASQLNQNSFNINNGVLTITPTADQKNQWKSNLMAMLVWNPWGQDVDRLGALFSKPPSPLKSMFLQRIGLFAGLNISTDPIQSIYTGLNFTYSKDIYLNIGCSFVNQVQSGKTYSVGNITSVSGLDNYLTRQYQAKFFVGVSFSPSQMLSYIANSQSTATN